jgi:uncharacterized protein YbjT (DUF2867 family)
MMDTTNREILVVGATGTQGGAVVRHLLRRGYRVRALCRDPERPVARALAGQGVQVFHGDLNDRASLDAAVKGAYGVFGVQNFWDGFPEHKLGREGEVRQGRNLLNAAKAAGVSHFVQSSGAGVTILPNIEVNRSKLAIELHGKSIGIPLTIIRGVFFMDNFANPAWGFGGAVPEGRLELPFSQHTRLQMLASDDLGYFVAMAFDHPDDFIGTAFDVAGDQLCMPEIAETFTRVMGRPVRFTGGPEGLEHLRAIDEDLGDLFSGVNERGFQAFIPGLRALHPEMLTFESYLRKAGWETRGGV